MGAGGPRTCVDSRCLYCCLQVEYQSHSRSISQLPRLSVSLDSSCCGNASHTCCQCCFHPSEFATQHQCNTSVCQVAYAPGKQVETKRSTTGAHTYVATAATLSPKLTPSNVLHLSGTEWVHSPGTSVCQAAYAPGIDETKARTHIGYEDRCRPS